MLMIMKRMRQESRVGTALVAGLFLILALLAALQYKWSTEVSEAESERMSTTLRTSIRRFQSDFSGELLRLCEAFQRPPETKEKWDPYAHRFADWKRIALHPNLVKSAYIRPFSAGKPLPLLNLDFDQQRAESSQWPAEMQDINTRLARPPAMARRRLVNPALIYYEWKMEEQVPALIHPVYEAARPDSTRPRFTGYLIVELSKSYMQKTYLPLLARRYFRASEGYVFQVAVVGPDRYRQVIYQSEPALPKESFAAADAVVNLVGNVPENFLPSLSSQAAGRSMPFIEPVRNDRTWQLAIKHRSGSVESAVNQMRRRNLAVSFGVLLLIGVSGAMVIVYAQRAGKLARMQLEFAAGVSHELRTPLAVITSAADNLADGVVSQGTQVRHYGNLIRIEGRRLAGMVEEILSFASMQAGKGRYTLEAVEIEAALDEALNSLRPQIESAGFHVEKQVQENMPLVRADAKALHHCIQNLLNNALKYGSEGRWIAVRAKSAGSPPSEVELTIEDHGVGIDPKDLPYIFDPFYRSFSVQQTQIHGTGLGLSIARDMLEGMGGRLTVESTPGKGSLFTLHLQVA